MTHYHKFGAFGALLEFKTLVLSWRVQSVEVQKKKGKQTNKPKIIRNTFILKHRKPKKKKERKLSH